MAVIREAARAADNTKIFSVDLAAIIDYD